MLQSFIYETKYFSKPNEPSSHLHDLAKINSFGTSDVEPWFLEWIEHVLPLQMKEMCRNSFFESDGVDKRVPVGIVSFMPGRIKGWNVVKSNRRWYITTSMDGNLIPLPEMPSQGAIGKAEKRLLCDAKASENLFSGLHSQIKGFVLLKISTGWVTELKIAEKQVTALFTSRISLNSKRQTNNLQCFLDNEIVAQV